MSSPTREFINAEIVKVNSNQEYAREQSVFGVPNKDSAALLAYCMVLQSPPSTPAEKAAVQKMLEDSLGNLGFNSLIGTLSSKSLRGTGMNSLDLSNLRTLSFKTRNLTDTDPIFDKMFEMSIMIKNNKELPEKEKFTLAEFGKISELAKLYNTLDILNRVDLIEGSERLSKLYIDAGRAHQLVGSIENEYKATVQVGPGTIVFDNTQKKSDSKGMTMSYYDKLINTVITGHTHASKLYSTPSVSEAAPATSEAAPASNEPHESSKEEVNISHINPRHEDRKFDMGEYLYADIYEIDIEQLISSEDKVMLQEKLGDDWINILKVEFKYAERKLHDKDITHLSGIAASSERQQQRAGVWTMFGGGIGHTKYSRTDFETVHQNMFSKHYEKNPCTMLCSEFVAHTTIAALVEVNKQLQQKHGIKAGHDVVQIPISQQEDLSVMHPDRLLAVLESKNCLKKVESLAAVKKYVKLD